jgi:hypothetical protein
MRMTVRFISTVFATRSNCLCYSSLDKMGIAIPFHYTILLQSNLTF